MRFYDEPASPGERLVEEVRSRIMGIAPNVGRKITLTSKEEKKRVWVGWKFISQPKVILNVKMEELPLHQKQSMQKLIWERVSDLRKEKFLEKHLVRIVHQN